MQYCMEVILLIIPFTYPLNGNPEADIRPDIPVQYYLSESHFDGNVTSQCFERILI